MSGLSRREFLKRAGIIAGAPALPTLPPAAAPIPTLAETLGRAFTLTEINARPDESSAITGRLAPDNITPITDSAGRWYQIPGGFVPREALQPIEPYRRPEIVETVGDGFWAEVIAPLSVIREWCAADAPVIARIGFGAVVYVMDRLVVGRDQVWYGLTDAPGSGLIGWAQALHYERWINAGVMAGSLTQSIKIDQRRAELTAYVDNRPVLRTAIACPAIRPGLTTLRTIQPGAARDSQILLGVPWIMALGTGQHVYGAFWHNRFGTMDGVTSLNTVELPVASARWLYAWLADTVDGIRVEIV